MTRLMPFVFESPDCMEWEENFFWTPRQVEKQKKNLDDKPEYDILPCRGELLLTCMYSYKQIEKKLLICFFDGDN
jgi:hypothetical protein